jgi:hypothetical protein
METAKYVSPTPLEWFGNAIRECGQTPSVCKQIPFNEICTNEETIANSGGTAITPAAFGSTRPSTFPQSSSSLRHKVPAKSHPHQITLEPL